jgi:DNA-binding NarL/FixJ family response regulator
MYRNYHVEQNDAIVVLGEFGSVTLTPWQVELLYQVCTGKSFKEIAKEYELSYGAIAACVTRIREKFYCKSRIELIAKCFQCNLVKPVGREKIHPSVKKPTF